MRFAPLWLAAVCALVLCVGLDRPGFVDQREARDADVARELLQRREILIPRYAAEPHFEKPFFAYLPEVAATFVAHGEPLGARAIRAALALALVLLTASVGAQHFGPRAGWCSAAVLATTLAMPVAARCDGTQVLATLLGWVGCAGLADALFGRTAGRDLRLLVAYVALAAAFLCAGPLPALWPAGAVALYLGLARSPDGWGRTRPWLGVAIVLGLAMPWYGAMAERFGAAFISRVLFFPYGVEARGSWFAGPVLAMGFLVVGAFPWSALLPGAMLHAATWWRFARPRRAPALTRSSADPVAREHREESAAHFFIAALAAALVPVVIYPGPPLTAALPALPAVALLCGRLLDHVFEDPPRVQDPVANAARMLALTSSVGALLLVLLASRLAEAAVSLRLLGALLLLAGWAPFLAQWIGRTRAAAALFALPAVIGAPIVTLRMLPELESYLNTRAAAEAFRATSPPQAPLLLVEPPPPSLRLYARHNLVVVEALGPALEPFRAPDGYAYVAFRPGREGQVVRACPTPIEILLRTPSLVLARTGTATRR
jgi:4-amino-4-deoxy-L-arabinose transferase-like glycosyltransferase